VEATVRPRCERTHRLLNLAQRSENLPDARALGWGDMSALRGEEVVGAAHPLSERVMFFIEAHVELSPFLFVRCWPRDVDDVVVRDAADVLAEGDDALVELGVLLEVGECGDLRVVTRRAVLVCTHAQNVVGGNDGCAAAVTEIDDVRVELAEVSFKVEERLLDGYLDNAELFPSMVAVRYVKMMGRFVLVLMSC